MNNYLIRLAEIKKIEKIQLLSQESIEHEKNISNKEYMNNMNWALSEQGFYKYAIEQYIEV